MYLFTNKKIFFCFVLFSLIRNFAVEKQKNYLTYYITIIAYEKTENRKPCRMSCIGNV